MSSEIETTRFFTIGNSKVSIGRFSYGFENIIVNQWGEGASLGIGSFCSIASATIFLGGNHRVDWITTYPFGHIYADRLGGRRIKGHPSTNGDVIIENDVWVGHNTTIMSGVTIGDGAVISANSHIVNDVAPYSIVGGNPAREIKLRFSPEIRKLLLELKWWELPLDFIKTKAAELCHYPDAEMLHNLLEYSQNYPRSDY